MVFNQKKNRIGLNATVATTFGVAMSTVLVNQNIEADIVDLTFDGGNFTVVNDCIITGSGPMRVDIDQVPDVAGIGADFAQWNDIYGGTGRTMFASFSTISLSRNILSLRANGISYGDVIDPATFTGAMTIGGNAGGGSNNNTFDGFGSAYVAFRTADGNVGWFQVDFNTSGPFTGPIRYISGKMGTDGEAVTVKSFQCCDCDFSLGDVNQDGLVDLLDVSPFVDLLLSETYACEGDVSKDLSVDLLDVDFFVQLVLAP